MGFLGQDHSESAQDDSAPSRAASKSRRGVSEDPFDKASPTPTVQTVLDGSVLGLPASEMALERVARALGRAGYANAVWMVDATLGVLTPAYLYAPPVLTASRMEWFSRRQTNPKRPAVSPGIAPEVHQALLVEDPVLGSAPGPAWFIDVSHDNQPLPPSVLGDADLLASAYLSLRVEDRVFGVLGVAGRRLTAPDVRTLSAIAAELALRLEFLRMNRPASPAIDRRQAERLLEEITQPLTALVARAEVAMDLVRHGPLGELPDHLAAMRDSAQRLAAWTDATHHLLGEATDSAPLRSVRSTMATDRPVAQP